MRNFKLLYRYFKKCDFLILVSFLLVFNYPYFQKHFFPLHDTQTIFGVFHYFYSELFFNKDLALWLPFHSYGFPGTLLQIHNVTPMGYLAALIGFFLKIKSALFIFKLSILANQMVFLSGMYLLSRLIYSRRSTAFLTCLGATMSTVWFSQIEFNFYIYYLLPWAFYFIVLFFKKERPEFLWISGIVMLSAWVGGTVLYFVGLWLFLLFVFFVVLCLKYKRFWRCLFLKSFSNIFLFLSFVVISVACILCGKMISHETSLYLTQRDFATGTTSLFTFLNYGGPAQLKDIIQHFFFQGSLFLSSTGKFNSTVYIGLLPLVFFVWSLLKVRNILFLAFLSVLISVFWFSFGGFFSAGVYFFPAMHLYRHIGFVYGIIKILILICAGFGLDYFWKVRAREKLGYFFIILAVFVFVFDVLSISRYVLISLLDPPVVEKLKAMNLMPEGLREFIPTVGRYFLSFSFLFIMAVITNFISKKKGIGREKKDSFIYGLIVLSLTIPFCLDLFSFQWTAYHNAPKFLRTNQILLESVEVNQPQFQEARVLEPFLERQKKAQKLMRRKEGFGGPYQQDSNFIQIDRCMVVDQSKAYFLSERVDRLLKISNPSNPSFRKILGWHHPKLRLVSRAAFCDTIEDARKQIQEHHDLENTVILRGVDERTRSTANSKSNSEIRQNIKVIKFSSNEITIETNVVDEAGAWLVYADAFHPGWHATVNGKKVNIYEAYLAFKAVHVGKGKSLVRFFFYDGLRSSLNIFIFMFCLVMSIVFVFVFLEILIFDMKHIEFLLDRISNKS